MLKNKYYFIIGWVFFFFWCFFFIIGYFYLNYGLDKVFCDSNAAIAFLGGSDGGSFLKAAKDVIDGKNTFFQSWVLGLWPPAMLVLGLLYLSMLSKIVSIGVFYAGVLSAVYAIICMTFLSYIIKKKMPSLLITLMLIIPYMLSWGSWYFIYISDSFSNLFFIYGIGLLFSAMNSNNINIYIKAGIVFTISALFRSHIFLSLLSTALILVFILFIKKIRSNLIPSNKVISSLKYTFAIIGLLIFAYHIVSGGKYCYNKADYIWTLPFIKEDVSFLEKGGIRTARDCNPIRGKEIADALENNKTPPHLRWIVIFSPLKYPIFYMRHKIPVGWNCYHSAGVPFVNWFLLFIFFSLVIRAFYRFYALFDEELIIFAILLGSFLASWGPSIILHFEARYFILFKLTILVCFVYEIVINHKQIALFLKK